MLFTRHLGNIPAVFISTYCHCCNIIIRIAYARMGIGPGVFTPQTLKPLILSPLKLKNYQITPFETLQPHILPI